MRLALRPVLSVSIAAAGLLFAACGDDGALENAPEGVSDEEYLEVLCTGLEEFSSALIGSADAEEIQGIMADYIASMEAVVPPRDASKFHSEYVEFLRQAQEEPLALVAAQPPLPPAAVRQRFVNKERDVEACKNPTFFATDVSDLSSPTP